MKSNSISRFAALALVAVAALYGSASSAWATSARPTRFTGMSFSAQKVKSGQPLTFKGQLEYKDRSGQWHAVGGKVLPIIMFLGNDRFAGKTGTDGRVTISVKVPQVWANSNRQSGLRFPCFSDPDLDGCTSPGIIVQIKP